jgi:hypothetical protein
VKEYPTGIVINAEYEGEIEWENPYTGKISYRPVYKRERCYWVETPEGECFEFGDSYRYANRRRATRFAELWNRVDGFEIIENESGIPIKIANMGKPAMSTYLKIVYRLDEQEIANRLNVSKRTVQQYLSKFKHRQR